MALFHDAYLFNLETFANKIKVYLPNPEMLYTYTRLRADAIQIHDDSPLVRILLSDYGGWVRSAFTQIAEVLPVKSDDIAFWLVILIYSEFRSGLHQMGLGSEWRLLQETLSKLGWSESQATLLIAGRTFRDFAQVRSPKGAAIPDYWNYFKPFSTSSSTGWLSLSEIRVLLDRLNQDEQKLSQLVESENVILMSKVYQSAQTMLNTAKDQDIDLCLIISG